MEGRNTLKTPHPDNPQHTDNLRTLSLLAAQGWEGSDASIEVCIFENGFAWRTLPEPDENGDDTLIIYAITGRHPARFDRCAMDSRLDFKKAFSWLSPEDWEDFLGTLGADWETWEQAPFAVRLEDLNRHYGRLNVMGDSYWEGFNIKNK